MPQEPLFSETARQTKTAITNVRVFNGKVLSEPTAVVIENDIIVEDASGADVIDGNGGVLLPGLIDAHIHLHGEESMRQMSQYGVTTGLDMASWPASKLNALRGLEGMADIRSPGTPATSPGSLHSLIMPLPSDALVANADDAARFVQDRIDDGVDYIKVIADVPGPDQPTLNAIVAAAHKHNKLVIAHASTFTPFQMAQDAKVDIITHVPKDKVLDEEAISRMVTDGCISIPTLVMMESVSQRPSLWSIIPLLMRPMLLWAIVKAKRQNPNSANEKYENSKESVTKMYKAGVPILAGTDANAAPGSPFQVKHGESLHQEMQLLVEAGLSNIDALRAATELPAKYFGLSDRGTVEVGKRADLLLISGDPLQDITATRLIQRVWCSGIEISGIAPV